MASTKPTTSYNGWKNRATWNVALWIGSDQGLYRQALDIVRTGTRTPYRDFAASQIGIPGCACTGDGVRWDDPTLDLAALNSMMRELS